MNGTSALAGIDTALGPNHTIEMSHVIITAGVLDKNEPQTGNMPPQSSF